MLHILPRADIEWCNDVFEKVIAEAVQMAIAQMTSTVKKGSFASKVCEDSVDKCQNASGKSVVDYAIASTSLFSKLINFQIYTFDKCLSDVHTPIWVTLKFDGKPQNCPVTDNNVNNTVNTNEYYKPVNTRWKPEKQENNTKLTSKNC